jgi:GTP-binding protein
VVDAYEGITAQDKHVLSLALEEKKGVILVFNKWDKVMSKPGIDTNTIHEKYLTYIRTQFNFLSYVTPLFISAIEGKRIDSILDGVIHIDEERKKRIRTSVFNDFLAQITLEHTPSGSRKSHKPKIYYGSQVDVNPPKFVISVNNPNHFHFSYLRYVENKIREFFGFEGTPIHIELHGKDRGEGEKAT